MSLESIGQKAKAILEAYYELEHLKSKNSSKANMEKQKSFILSLTGAIKKDALAEKE